jgi:hypothetical protein
MMAYLLAIGNYLVDRQGLELRQLRGNLDCDDAAFESLLESLRYHRRDLLLAAWVAGPVMMVVINFNNPGFVKIRSGQPFDWATAWGWFIALAFWVALMQMLVVLFSNAFTFSRLGARVARLDLLDTAALVPFARVGIRNLLICVGAYAMMPLILVKGANYLPAMSITLAVSLPATIALAIIPMMSIRNRISQEKDLELARIQKAMHGDSTALSDSAISRDADHVGFTELVLYRQMIQDVNEWPVDFPIFIRLTIYVVIPLLAWIGAALVERLVDFVLS